jgi:hypothetical protein
MTLPITINSEDPEEFVEVPLSEYEATLRFASSIADQNALILDAIAAMVNTITENGNIVRDTFAQMAQALNIDVVVPDFPPFPPINVTTPEARVVIQPNSAKKVATVKRGKQGEITSIVLETAK